MQDILPLWKNEIALWAEVDLHDKIGLTEHDFAMVIAFVFAF